MTSSARSHSETIAPRRVWSPQSLVLIALFWLVLQIGGLFTPGLLDDVDSVYIQVAREMLQRHDFVTPTIDGIRFFDKPPLMYWLAAGSMHVFGQHDWAARLPLALGVLALLFAVYWLGLRLYAAVSPARYPDRAALYASLATATSIGPYLYTRFYIPDILIALWMTLSVHLFLLARERASGTLQERTDAGARKQSALWPSLGFGFVMALDVLTKGLIGIVFPLLFVFLFLLIRRELKRWRALHVLAAAGVFLLVAAPWHVLAAIRNPAIAMPAGVGLPARAGWTWFYLYNEHIARFLGRRIPHDYGQVPIPLFWFLLFVWLLPWAAFLVPAVRNAVSSLRSQMQSATRFAPAQDAALTTLLWAGVILGFFTVSSRQEYYHLPALPALALLVGGLLATADRSGATDQSAETERARSQALRWSAGLLMPLGALVFAVCSYFALTAHTPPTGADLYAALNNDPTYYNLSLGHVFDLTGRAMGFFRAPLVLVAVGMLVLGPASHLLRRRRHTLTANLAVATGMSAVLLAVHSGLARFYPILGSKPLAQAIQQDGLPAPVLIDGELTSGSSLLFYLNNPVLLVNGRVNGPWFGSFWPDARPIFLNDADLERAWQSRSSIYLMTYHPEQRVPELCKLGPVLQIASSGGKTVLRNAATSATKPARIAGTSLCR